ncbi:MAG: nuclear transport factor 2 family protein [Kofleriaceae bacterium]|nr:nuclear transport factor 2 family protein [Myxococcales bacterium]MCB9565323.1 nuclear transport factor 2 family protein [Kofleriaceae bacterium]
MEREILAANQAFYDAFVHEDADAMDALWARRAPVACVHPGWSALLGRDQVMASWRAIMAGGAPPIRASRPRVHQVGDVAYVVCDERIDDGRLVATNVFVREDNAWRLIHHHASEVSALAAPENDDDDVPTAPPRSILN